MKNLELKNKQLKNFKKFLKRLTDLQGIMMFYQPRTPSKTPCQPPLRSARQRQTP
jgi:hypothetical protein